MSRAELLGTSGTTGSNRLGVPMELNSTPSVSEQPWKRLRRVGKSWLYPKSDSAVAATARCRMGSTQCTVMRALIGSGIANNGETIS